MTIKGGGFAAREGQRAGAVAAVTAHPECMALGLRCQPGGGLYMSVVPTKRLRLPPAGRPLLIGADSDLAVYASTDGGDEWREITYLSLAGSTKAFRALERQCPRVAR